jgi:hypothetical protein
MNEQQAAAFALANGAELSIGGRTINPGRERFSLSAVGVGPEKLPAPAAEPAPRPTQTYATEAEVQALLAARDAEWASQLQQIAMLIAQTTQRPPEKAGAPTWDFDVQYGKKGEITNIRAVPAQLS